MEGGDTSSSNEKETQQPVVPSSELPVCCQLDPERGMFRVIRAKGKTLSSGGFGVAISEEIAEDGTKEESQKKEEGEEEKTTSQPTLANKTSETRAEETTSETLSNDATTKKTCDYLFIEEVVFLHERGFLECLPPSDSISAESSLDSSQLYQLLPAMGMSLAIYFVYAHLRSQDFRVLRHCPHRLDLLQQQKEENFATRKGLRHRLRESIQNAVAPSISSDVTGGVSICWDVYQPDATFAKTRPGPPDFYVAVTFYNQAQVSFSDLRSLVLDKSQGIPLKLATVSDSGIVVMFGVTNFGVPSIAK